MSLHCIDLSCECYLTDPVSFSGKQRLLLSLGSTFLPVAYTRTGIKNMDAPHK